MIKRYNWAWVNLLRLTDLSLITGAYLFIETQVVLRSGAQGSIQALSIVLLLTLWLLLAQLFGIYRLRRRLEWTERRKALAVAFVLFYLIASKLSTKGLIFCSSFSLLVALAAVSIYGAHLVSQGALMYLRAHGFNQRRMLIYGAGSVGLSVAERFITRPWIGMKIVGFLDDSLRLQGALLPCAGRKIPVLGTGGTARDIIMREGIHEVVASLPNRAQDRLVEFVFGIGDLNVNVSIAPDLSQIVSVQARLEDLWGVPLITVRQPMIQGVDAVVKRAFDLVASVVGIVLTAPLMILIGALVKLDSNGPIIFSQERIGRNGKPFRMYKFRTMVADAEAKLADLIDFDTMREPAFKLESDPRVTALGRVLRRSSLDELPQLFNVLVGEMSIVGPRPEERRVVAKYTYEQRQRLAVKPGITGPMQVNGRGGTRFDKRLALELEYIRDYSLTRDVELLLKTFPSVISGKGAY